MPSRLATIAGLTLAVVLPLATAVPAAAQSPAQSYLFNEKRFGKTCRPPLKYAAGACVRRCPAGYQDMGRTCRFQDMRR